MAVVNLRDLLKGKIGWVSLSPDHKKIIAQSKTLKNLSKKLKQLGDPDGVITPVIKDYSSYVG